ncbi:MAG: hypothetical protein WCK35_29720, partial [Chloroflexota bacterium]
MRGFKDQERKRAGKVMPIGCRSADLGIVCVVYKQAGNELRAVPGTSIGGAFLELAQVNCDLWHEHVNVYEFERVPAVGKNVFVKQLALLNLRANQCSA